MRQHESGPNGFPSWAHLMDIVSQIKIQLGGLQTGQDLTIEHVSRGFDRVHARIDNLHLHGNREIRELRDRVSTLEAAPKPGRKTWLERLGISLKELISLLILIAMSLTGTLSSDIIVAWFH